MILLLALVVLGPEKLPDALRRAGRTYAELKKMGNSFQDEMRSVIDEPVKEMRETADLLRYVGDRSPTPTPSSLAPAGGHAAAPATADDGEPGGRSQRGRVTDRPCRRRRHRPHLRPRRQPPTPPPLSSRRTTPRRRSTGP